MAAPRDVTPRATRVILNDPFTDDTYVYTRPLLVGYGLTTSQAYVTRAVAALASNAIVSPFDVVQTLAQVGSKEGKKSYGEIVEDIWNKEGLTGFFRGTLVGSLRFVETAVLNYVIYYAVKKALADELGVLSENNHQIANAASIVLSSLLTYPLEVVRTRLILDFDKQKYPSGAVECFTDTLNTEGWSGLFSGAALSAIASYTMIEVMERIWTPIRVGLAITPPKLVDAAIQSFVAQTLFYPVDTVLKMVQAPHFYKRLHPDVPFDGVMEAASSTTSKYGFFSLWRGYVVAALKVVPFIMATSLTYQLTADAFERSNIYRGPVGIANQNTRVERLG